MNANVGECVITELPETETTDPKTKIKVRVEDLIFEYIPTIISNVQSELVLDGRESFHTRQRVKTNKDFLAEDFRHDFNLLEKRLEKCCKEFDKIKKRMSDSKYNRDRRQLQFRR